MAPRSLIRAAVAGVAAGVADLVSGSLGKGTQYPLKLGAALLATIPVAVLFVIFQRYFVRDAAEGRGEGLTRASGFRVAGDADEVQPAAAWKRPIGVPLPSSTWPSVSGPARWSAASRRPAAGRGPRWPVGAMATGMTVW